MKNARWAVITASLGGLLFACNGATDEVEDVGTPMSGAQDGGLVTDAADNADGAMAVEDAAVAAEDGTLPDAALSGPECQLVQDCDAVCAWFVDCSVDQCRGYDRTDNESLDGVCRGACDILADVLCNHRQCAETIDYIRGLDPTGDYASACADDDPDPGSP